MCYDPTGRLIGGIGRMKAARKIFLLAAFSAAAAITAGCGSNRGSIEGYVYLGLAGPSPLLITGLESAPQGFSPAAEILIGVDGTSRTTRTDAAGHFILEGIQPGRRLLTATGDSGKSGHRLVTVTPDEIGVLAPLAPSPQAEWTILVYMAADNNLDYEGNADIEEMEEVVLTEDVRVIVQFDGAFSGDSRRIQVRDEAQGGSAVIDDMGEVDMSDGTELQDFVEFGLNHFPAERVMLVLWNHGGGVWPRSISTPVSPQGVAWDDTTGLGPWDCLTTDEIRMSLEKALAYASRSRLDIINFDACLMQMHEVALELEGLADYMVGSEEATPLKGNPYAEILSVLAIDPTTSGSELSAAIVQEFCAAYPNSNNPPVLQSAIRIRGPEWEVYLNAVDTFAAALMDLDYDGLEWMRSNHIGVNIQEPDLWCENFSAVPIPRFAYPENADLGVFLDRLVEDPDSPAEVADSARAVRTALSGIVVANGAASSQAALADYGGLSILLPRGLVDWRHYRGADQYACLKVANTNWYLALRTMMPPVGSIGGFEFKVSWSGAEMDLYTVEPHVGVYGVGSDESSPNGSFSPDMVSFSPAEPAEEHYKSASEYELGRYFFYVRCGAAYGANPVRFTVDWTLAGKTMRFEDELAEGAYAVYTWTSQPARLFSRPARIQP